ncbi:type III polyketide synthase [Streptomyces roseicoloratus]|uniref:3-oxoacyl-[acyl-carrier-protein] synthase III C-terminal domain-containing protein n=1 Tax=Streptomyces roseicoloratus TaxID=2508722 RepID=A0ABY9RP97_9ACTN|nr:3-oxoacyl-[acyl-carrier-protein] synthase III C-terminal domain-containing protein [Streptomyces roseicoloratus]WMX43727.1 3-oxoacyl-[acyl-carrier-protein] synthase III C-terminal domain-containing protein [Streptomyces roseicoloratus]
MTRVLAVSTAFPPHRYMQHEITEDLVSGLPPGPDRELVRRLHAATGVESRRLALPLDRYRDLGTFGDSNRLFVERAVALGAEAVEQALHDAGVRPEAVDLVVSTTVTGIATPSLEARLAARIGLRPDVRRTPLFGLGCSAGAAGLARVHDFLDGRPGGTALLLSTELCSLTLQRSDLSVANLVAGGLFGDGAAALVAVGGDGSGADDAPVRSSVPGVVATRSRLYPGTGHLLGWDVGDWGFRMVLGPELPELVRLHVAEEVESFLAVHDLKPGDVGAWICHPGGPKILDALADGLGLPAAALAPSRRALAAYGNLSSASVLQILKDVQSDPPPPGTTGLVLAFGPGFSSELVLLAW